MKKRDFFSSYSEKGSTKHGLRLPGEYIRLFMLCWTDVFWGSRPHHNLSWSNGKENDWLYFGTAIVLKLGNEASDYWPEARIRQNGSIVEFCECSWHLHKSSVRKWATFWTCNFTTTLFAFEKNVETKESFRVCTLPLRVTENLLTKV